MQKSWLKSVNDGTFNHIRMPSVGFVDDDDGDGGDGGKQNGRIHNNQHKMCASAKMLQTYFSFRIIFNRRRPGEWVR